jgi:hypothetical protein
MAQLLKYEGELPNDFFSTKTHMWIMLDGKIHMSKKKQIHAEIWGEKAWEIPDRGYYNDYYGLVTCHVKMTEEMVNKVAKKFPRAMHYKGSWE